MARLIATILIACFFLLPACTKSRTTPPGGDPGAPPPGVASPPPPGQAKSAPGQVPGKVSPGNVPPGSAGAKPPNAVPVTDGPVLQSVLTGVKQLTPFTGGSGARVAGIEGAVVKEVLGALNMGQTLKGNRHKCKFTHAFTMTNEAGEEIGAVVICGPKPGANNPAVFIDQVQNKEWRITIPNAAALSQLLEKKLPGSKVSTMPGE